MSNVCWNYFYPVMEANDNRVVMVPMFDGLSFQGYQVVKSQWKRPANYETFNLGEQQ